MTGLRRNRVGVKLAGARVVITGATSGIGRSLAFAVARHGGRIVLAARGREGLERTAIELASAFPACLPHIVPCNVSERFDVLRLMERAVKWMGGVDILVNNAGTSVYGSAELMGPEDAVGMFRVHVLGALHGMAAVIPQMRTRGSGLIVNVSSLVALYGLPYLSVYSAAKAGQAALSQSFRAELRGTGIRIMVVYPGYTETGIFDAEKKVGGARRPSGQHRSSETVAASIIKAMRSRRDEVVLSPEGKLLWIARSVWPRLVDAVYQRIAENLQEEYCHA